MADGDRKAFNKAVRDLEKASIDPDPSGKKKGLVAVVKSVIRGIREEFRKKHGKG